MNNYQNQQQIFQGYNRTARPVSRSRSKILSPASLISPRSQKFLQNSKRPNKILKNEKIIVWIPEQQLFDNFSSIRTAFPKNKILFNRIEEAGFKDATKGTKSNVWVITTVDAFTMNYVKFKQLYLQNCQKWFILSPAINSKTSQQNLNKMYHPIRFQYIASFSEMCNFLLGYKDDLTNIYIDKVVTFLDDCKDQIFLKKTRNLISIQQRQSYNTNENINEIIILHNIKNIKKLQAKNLYFITNQAKFLDNQTLQLPISTCGNNLTLILMNNFVQINKLHNFKQFQDQFISKNLNPQYLLNVIKNNLPYYLRKLVDQVIKRREICLFYHRERSNSDYDHDFIERIAKEAKQMGRKTFFIPFSYYQQSYHSYELSFNQKILGYSMFSISKPQDLSSQIRKIIYFLDMKQKSLEYFKSKKSSLKKMIFHFYNKDNYAGEHIISLLLKQLGININIIKNLDTIYQTHKITIVYGMLNYSEIMMLKDFHNVFIVPLEIKYEDCTPSWQQQELQTFMNVTQSAYNQFYGKKQRESVEVRFDIIYEQKQRIQQIQSLLSLPMQFVGLHECQNFGTTSKQFKNYSRHLVFMEMSEFNEEIENIVKDIQWDTASSISVQIYLKYGEQFIYRNKEGGFKFLKTIQVQEIINTLKENYLVTPEPEILVPQPYLEDQQDLPVNSDPQHFQAQKNNEQVKDFANQQIIKYYICLHRSIPSYTFKNRCKKQYKLLVYNRIEQIIVLCHYLHTSQTLIVIANHNSTQIYDKIMSKIRYLPQKISFLYLKDINQSTIRKSLDNLLLSLKINNTLGNSQKSVQKFIPVIIYNNLNGKIAKAVKKMKKLLGCQLKILFLKGSEYQQLNSHRLSLKIHQKVKLYSLGFRLENIQNIKSIKSLIILAMHPDSQSFEHQLDRLKFSLKLFVVKKLYGQFPKNHEIVSKNQSPFQNMMKSSRISFSNNQKYYDRKLTESSVEITQKSAKKPSKLKKSNRSNSSIKLNSTKNFHNDTKISVITSQRVYKYYHSKNVFYSQQQLILQIIKNQNNSKLNIVIICEEQFDLLQLMQSNNLRTKVPDVIWLVCTPTISKQIFIGQTILFVYYHSIDDVIDCLVRKYKKWINFDSCYVKGNKIKEIERLYGRHERQLQGNSKSFTFQIITQKQLTNIQKYRQDYTLYLCVNENTYNELYNIIFFPSEQCLTNFLNSFISIFTQKDYPQIKSNYGNLILCSQKQIYNHTNQLIDKVKCKNFTIIKKYMPQKLQQLLICSIYKIIIFYDNRKTNRNKEIDQIESKLRNSIQVDGNKQIIHKILQHMIVQ